MKAGTMLKACLIALSFVLLIVLGAQIISFTSQAKKAERDYAELERKLERAKEDQSTFAADMDYYLNSENLKKELKGRFNYKEPGEKMLILINRNNSSSAASSSSR